MEEHEAEIKNKQVKKIKVNRSKAVSDGAKGLLEDVSESGSEFGGRGQSNDYEQMLQKYEAEVRNHIKIEQ